MEFIDNVSLLMSWPSAFVTVRMTYVAPLSGMFTQSSGPDTPGSCRMLALERFDSSFYKAWSSGILKIKKWMMMNCCRCQFSVLLLCLMLFSLHNPADAGVWLLFFLLFCQS